MRPRHLALAAAVLFSTGGTAIKFCAFGPWQVASLRCGFAAAALLAFAPQTRRAFSWRLAPVALAYATQSLLFATSNKLTTAADAIFLQSTSPLYVLLLSQRLLGEKVTRRDAMFLATLATGLVLFFVDAEPIRATATDPIVGNLLAAGSGVAWALTVMGIRRLGRADGGDGPAVALQATMYGNVLAFAIALPFSLPLAGHDARDWGAVVFLGVIQIALAYWCLSRAARDVPALELSLLLLLEPVLSAAWAWMYHHERPGAWALVGAATILAATAVRAFARR